MRALVTFCMVAAVSACHADAQGDKKIPPPPEPVEFKVEISPPDADSERGKALAAINAGTDFVLYSLQPWTPPEVPGADAKYGTPEYRAYEAAQSAAWDKSQKEWCKRDDCLYGNLILGKTKPSSISDIDVVRNTAKLSLAQVPNYATACAPLYRHAIEFIADGRKFQTLLCYGCGQVAVAIDGALGPDDQAYGMGNEGDLDAILRKANIPLAPKSDH